MGKIWEQDQGNPGAVLQAGRLLPGWGGQDCSGPEHCLTRSAVLFPPDHYAGFKALK